MSTSAQSNLSKKIPRHIAIVMDGNGRWAKQRHLPRIAGHKEGLNAVRRIIQACGEQGIQALTLFAFSSENWRRPKDEVSSLMGLFLTALKNEVKKLHENKVQLKFIGDHARFNPDLQAGIQQAEQLTQHNTGLKLVIAADYGGRWDIVQAAKQIIDQVQAGKLLKDQIDETHFNAFLSLNNLPEPDLFIRTSGEQRISNFMLWQLAYSELYFTEVLWPDFNEQELMKALAFYESRERRFGFIAEQLTS